MDIDYGGFFIVNGTLCAVTANTAFEDFLANCLERRANNPDVVIWLTQDRNQVGRGEMPTTLTIGWGQQRLQALKKHDKNLVCSLNVPLHQVEDAAERLQLQRLAWTEGVVEYVSHWIVEVVAPRERMGEAPPAATTSLVRVLQEFSIPYAEGMHSNRQMINRGAEVLWGSGGRANLGDYRSRVESLSEIALENHLRIDPDLLQAFVQHAGAR